jgi:hypothetical protein
MSRTRQAHIRITDHHGDTWKVTWSPTTGEFVGRRLHARTQYSIAGCILCDTMLHQGNITGAAPKEDPRQLTFA